MPSRSFASPGPTPGPLPVRSVAFAAASVVVAGMLAVAPALPAPAQEREPIRLEHLYGPDALDFSPDLPSVRWLPGGGRYLSGEGEGADRTWTVVDAATGGTSPLYDPNALAAALAAELHLDEEAAEAAARPSSPRLSPDGRLLLLDLSGDLLVWEIGGGSLTRLTRSPEPEELARFSPAGDRIAFVRENDLYVVDLAGRELRLTTGGGPDLLNGKLDWVYQEEIYGRGDFQAHWWSPDGSRIAYLQSDERDVPRFTVVDHVPYRPDLEVYPYPKAGDPNPKARLLAVSSAGGASVPIDPGAYGHAETLTVNVAFAPDGALWSQVQDRRQTFLDLHRADPETGASERVLRETSEAWVNVNGPPVFLADGGFLWFSERTGFRHLYRYGADGSLAAALTDGDFEVRRLHAVDEDAGFAWASATKSSSIGLDVLRVALDGSGAEVMSAGSGSHQAVFPEGGGPYFVQVSSDLQAPPRMTLRAASDASEVREIHPGSVPALDRFELSTPELLTVPAADGTELEAMLVRPPDFDPDREHPAWVHVYGGPHAPQVRNAWRGVQGMWLQYLAAQGIVVFVVDNRIASGKGVASTWPVYRNFGEQELKDLVDAVDWLAARPYVDGDRIGIDGWSFGGYMTLFALTRSDRFRGGIAGGSVVDWRDYDSIYTERYMSTPSENPDGYERSSIRSRAADLHGDLLMIHGTMDDNVHMQNTLQLAHDLQKAGKPFELMLYPKSRHGITDPALRLHLRRTMAAFIRKTVAPTRQP